MKRLENSKSLTSFGVERNTFDRFYDSTLLTADNKSNFISEIINQIKTYDQNLFYPLVGDLLNDLGFNCKITRAGDTNNRSDGYIVHQIFSIPIEIKSPTEIGYINNKSIRQALENKIILLSRKFYQTTQNTTSLVVGFEYPANRSGVYDLIEDIYISFKINIGIISIQDLLKITYDSVFLNIPFDKEKLFFLKGQL